MKKIISTLLVVELVIFGVLLLLPIIFNADVFAGFLGGYFLFWGTLGVIGINSKKRIGLTFALNFQFLLLFLCILYLVFEQGLNVFHILAFVISAILVYSLIEMNKEQIRTIYGYKKIPYLQTISTAFFSMLILALTFLLIFHPG